MRNGGSSGGVAPLPASPRTATDGRGRACLGDATRILKMFQLWSIDPDNSAPSSAKGGWGSEVIMANLGSFYLMNITQLSSTPRT